MSRVDSALALAGLGWRVFPTQWLKEDGVSCSCGKATCRTDIPGSPAGKHPRTAHGFKDATTEGRLIRAWWEGAPLANIAVATGSDSGIFVVDIDMKKHNGHIALETWGGTVGLQVTGPDGIKTLTSRTRSGGAHLFFTSPPSGVPSRTGWLEGVDVRGEGGYVLVPPSQGYEWATRGVRPAEAPEALIEAVRAGGVKAALPDMTAGEVIPEGQRDETVFRLACQLFRKLINGGMSVSEASPIVWARMQAINAAQCKPPLEQDVVTAKVQSAASQSYEAVTELPAWRGSLTPAALPDGPDGGPQHEPAMPPGRIAPAERHPANDHGNALRLIDAYGTYIKYVPEWKWMVWDGRVWKPDVDSVEVTKLALTLPEIIQRESEALDDDEEDMARWGTWALQSGFTHRVDAALKLARADDRVRASVDMWDTERLHLACKNGTVNLRTGELWPHMPEDCSTFIADVEYDPDARDGKWERFLESVTGGDKEVEAFLQRAVGYTLTGVTDSEAFFLIAGPAKTGKTTFIEAIQAMMGPYADTTDASTFLHVKGGVRNTEYATAKMRGTRLLYVDELPESARLDENLVKKITSGGDLQGRHIYGKPFTFKPTAKVWFATNHAPAMYDDAIWRRVNKIMFTNVIDTPDPTIKEHLRTSAKAAVLRWAVLGAMDWLAHGRRLDPPQSVLDATSEYHGDNDKFGQFIEECLEVAPAFTSTTRALYAVYSEWCRDAGEYAISRNIFTRKLKERGLAIDVAAKKVKINGRTELPVTGVRVSPELVRPDWP